jgi:hypothetical protein
MLKSALKLIVNLQNSDFGQPARVVAELRGPLGQCDPMRRET